jgi:hypothetical protein
LQPDVLDRQTRALVQLSALLAVDAATTTLRWAAEVASSRGADDAALDVDLELDGWDGTLRALLPK